MKLLFDQNISFRIIKKIINQFPESKHISAIGLSDCEDPDIWTYAKSNNYAIVTFDSDFFEISLIKGHPPKIVWLRTGNLTTIEISFLLNRNQNVINDFLNKKEFENLSCLELEY
jgi:predicted nuclease of predicted toxin-antitoxin system